MKKVYLLFALLVVGLSAKAAPNAATDLRNPFGYGDAFIFTEGGVEFAVFPNGEFDFYFNPRSVVPGFGRNNPFSFNGGYNYDPFVQYDDYGAVIQIERVPIYYDYFGRITRAGRVQIGYNHFGMVNRIGNLFLRYDPYDHYTGYSGYINSHNRFYTFRPWHEFYRRPAVNYTVVYDQPYRRYYVPQRMNYGRYKKYYKQNSHTNFRRSYYTPGDRVTTYYRGNRSSDERNIKSTPAETRSNRNSARVPKVQQQAQRRTVTSERRTNNVQRPVRSRATQSRSSVTRSATTTREARSESTNTRRAVPQASAPENTSRSRSSRGRGE